MVTLLPSPRLLTLLPTRRIKMQQQQQRQLEVVALVEHPLTRVLTKHWSWQIRF
jgi:hypothetical protein